MIFIASQATHLLRNRAEKRGGRGQRQPSLNRRRRRRRGRKRVEHVLAQSTVCTSARARVGLGLLEEKLSGLGWTAELLLRTMRLDVMLLGSREEEMSKALAQLEGQWEVLEMLLEEQRSRRREQAGIRARKRRSP